MIHVPLGHLPLEAVWKDRRVTDDQIRYTKQFEGAVKIGVTIEVRGAAHREAFTASVESGADPVRAFDVAARSVTSQFGDWVFNFNNKTRASQDVEISTTIDIRMIDGVQHGIEGEYRLMAASKFRDAAIYLFDHAMEEVGRAVRLHFNPGK